MKSVISKKGQVTIPKRLREKLGLKPGQALVFEERDGRLVATKQQTQDPVSEVYGILRMPVSTDSLMRRLRGKT